MHTIGLIHWNAAERTVAARTLRKAGFKVLADFGTGPGLLKQLEAESPEAVIIDLSRLPSQGRDVAIAIRMRKGTRRIPLVLADGDPAKVAPIRALLPDAAFCGWDEAAAAVKRAIKAAPQKVVVPKSVFAAYAGRPLAEKLGIQSGSRVAHVSSPDDIVAELRRLRPKAALVPEPDESADLTLWFVRSEQELGAELEAIVQAGRRAPVWIAWPKKGSGLASDLSQQVVRQRAMAAGLVDYKICSVDRDWSALLFTWRGPTG